MPALDKDPEYPSSGVGPALSHRALTGSSCVYVPVVGQVVHRRRITVQYLSSCRVMFPSHGRCILTVFGNRPIMNKVGQEYHSANEIKETDRTIPEDHARTSPPSLHQSEGPEETKRSVTSMQSLIIACPDSILIER
ncbi:hypothetical protein N7G274_001854 [Stereocaulon virgatum]|uniref:Uncharacterized protein n=1 Tax=Stereocaulon virgatum TaxID=373712 RepID=A0ABR4AKW9_9LECA